MANYYCMMAGLPDLKLADAKPALSIPQMKEQLAENLTEGDAKLMFFYFLRWDCENVVRLLKNPDAEIEPLGNFSAEQYADMITSARELTFNVHRYPAFMSVFIREYEYNKDKSGFFAEDTMLFEYLQFALQNCKNSMMREWYRLQLDINNILTAMIARRNGWAVGDYIQGNDEVTEMIRTNNSKDFDLGFEFDYVKELMKIVDEPDPVQKEKRIDAFKWVWLDDQTFFEPFDINAVFAYVCKLDLLHRWEKLDPETGKETFRRIIDDLRGEAKVPEEFVR
ncbi:MAG: DUF2764 family protein [Bacteroidaceae bacterium]|nr:DUF2764 family protein [Bacteroidaceae bacterium]